MSIVFYLKPGEQIYSHSPNCEVRRKTRGTTTTNKMKFLIFVALVVGASAFGKLIDALEYSNGSTRRLLEYLTFVNTGSRFSS